MMQTESASTVAPPRYRSAIWTLLILAPVIAEVLSGATRLSVLFVLVPEVMVWGGGALLCREIVRRWRAGALSLLLLGLALSVAEEFIIQQTSLAPLPFPGSNASYGRYFGVNWVYFLFMLGYESVWVVLVPVQLTELLFPSYRNRPWLRLRGLIATCIAFLIGCRIAWYGWTQQALKRLGVAPYHTPRLTIALGFIVIALLALLAWLLRSLGHSGTSAARNAWSPWITAIVAFAMSAGWFKLIAIVFAPHPQPSAWITLVSGCAWGFLAILLLYSLSAGHGWNDKHRWALSFGAIFVCMAGSSLSSAGYVRTDFIFKNVADVLALVGLILLGRRVWHRAAMPEVSEP